MGTQCAAEPSIPEGLRLDEQEKATGRALARHGVYLQFRERVHGEGPKNPDVIIDGVAWEFKAPRGSSEKNTIANQFARARRQAERLVLDLARCGLPDEIAISQAERRLFGQIKIKELIILDSNGRMTRYELPDSV